MRRLAQAGAIAGLAGLVVAGSAGGAGAVQADSGTTNARIYNLPVTPSSGTEFTPGQAGQTGTVSVDQTGPQEGMVPVPVASQEVTVTADGKTTAQQGAPRVGAHVRVENTGTGFVGSQMVTVDAPAGFSFAGPTMYLWRDTAVSTAAAGAGGGGVPGRLGEEEYPCAVTAADTKMTCADVPLDLQPGQGVVLYPQLAVAADAPVRDHDVTFTVGDPQIGSGDAVVGVTAAPVPQVSVTATGDITGAPGDVRGAEVIVQNTGTVPVGEDTVLAGAPAGWAFTQDILHVWRESTGEGEEHPCVRPNQGRVLHCTGVPVNLAPGQWLVLYPQVQIAAGATPGTHHVDYAIGSSPVTGTGYAIITVTGGTEPGAGPTGLAGTADLRTDGSWRLHGINLTWTIGQNDGSGEPGDWNGGRPDYPKEYEVYLDGQPAQTVYLDWCSHLGGCWNWARTHWVNLGEDPSPDGTRVKIRAMLGDGTWSAFSNEILVLPTSRAGAAAPVITGPDPAQQTDEAAPRHGSTSDPVSRALSCSSYAGGHDSQDPMCAAARAAGVNIWQQVQPTAAAMLADPPFNPVGRYSEYRKFSTGADVCSAGNPAYAGLDLANDAQRQWVPADFSHVHNAYTFRYQYEQNHPGEYWTMEWFITKPGWQPSQGVSWNDLEQTPFMVGHYDSLDEYRTETLPARTGDAVIVQIWAGPGGNDLPGLPQPFPKAGEFFTSCSDVTYTHH